MKLKSYKEEHSSSSHTVDEKEWQNTGIAYAEQIETIDPVLAVRIFQDAVLLPGRKK